MLVYMVFFSDCKLLTQIYQNKLIFQVSSLQNIENSSIREQKLLDTFIEIYVSLEKTGFYVPVNNIRKKSVVSITHIPV